MTSNPPSSYAPRLNDDDLAQNVPDLLAAPPVRWGIMGAGKIAGSFCDGLRTRTNMTVTAIGSRAMFKAQAFADKHAPGAYAHGSYQFVADDPDVDVVYVATPHSHHLDAALTAIRAGKPVLVEKPLTRSAMESEMLIDAARRAGVFCMEAMWTRFLPHIAAMRGAIARGEIGVVKTVIADFDMAVQYSPEHRLFAPELAGGAILDVGIYPIQLAHDLLGMPAEFVVRGTKAPTGVDDHVAMTMVYDGGQHALLHTSSRAAGPVAAIIVGTEGRIEMPHRFHQPTDMVVTRYDGERWTFTSPVGEGKVYEAAEVARLLRVGALESPRHTWADTLELAALMDEARRQVGVKYPGE